MNSQQIIAMLIVSVAAVFLGRNLVASVRSFFSKKQGGCAGCGKCGFAPKESAAQHPGLIPLIDIHSLPKK